MEHLFLHKSVIFNPYIILSPYITTQAVFNSIIHSPKSVVTLRTCAGKWTVAGAMSWTSEGLFYYFRVRKLLHCSPPESGSDHAAERAHCRWGKKAISWFIQPVMCGCNLRIEPGFLFKFLRGQS